MPNRTRMFAKLLVLVVLALPLALAQNLSAEEAQTPSPAAAQAQDLTDFLGSLADQALPGAESFTPAPQNKVQYCAYQACPTGQRCLYCNRNWVCIFEYPDDPERVPSGCSTGGGVQ